MMIVVAVIVGLVGGFLLTYLDEPGNVESPSQRTRREITEAFDWLDEQVKKWA